MFLLRIKSSISKYKKDKESRRLLINVLGNYLSKGGAMIVSLLVMPAYMRYFKSKAVLGMWFTVIQLLNWIMLFDFGIGGGLRNKMIEPLKNGDNKRVTELISAAFISVGGIVLLLIIIQCFLVDVINWHALLGVKVDDISRETLNTMVHILIVGVCIRFFSSLISHMLYALQKAVLPSLMILLSNVLILIYLYIARPTGNDSDILKLAYVNSIANNLPAFIAMIWLFFTVLKGMFPRFSAFKISVAKEVLGTGGILFYLQIIIMVLFNVKELYISWFVSTEAVVEYQVYYKLIGMVGGLFSLALTPVWSAVTKALVENRREWIKSLYKKGLYLIALFGILQFLIVAIMPWVVKIWLKENAISVSRIIGLIFCIYNVIYMWMMLNYNFACGMARTKIISIWLTVAGVLNLLLTIFGCYLYNNWVMIIVATAVATIPCAIFVQKDIFKVIKSMNNNIGEIENNV